MTLTATGIEARVCEIIAIRQQLGVKKYGCTVAQNPLPLRDWHVHHLEELLDAAIYVAKIIAEIDKREDDLK